MDELTTPEGFLLRPWLPDDASAVLRAFAPAEMDRQADRPVDDRSGALAWIAERTRERGARTGYSWAVVGEEGEALGCVALNAVNRTHDTGWVSYWTTESARGRGVAAAGVRALARWAFDELGLYRLELGHRTDNPASCRVALRSDSHPRASTGPSCGTAMSATTSSGTRAWPTMMSTFIDE